MAIRIQFRRALANQWSITNPTLAQGELGLELDTGRFKVGNGIDNWNTLVYSSGPPGPAGESGPPGPPGIGDMQTLIYDPQGVAANVFDLQNSVGSLDGGVW